jgi:hypothetical protein
MRHVLLNGVWVLGPVTALFAMTLISIEILKHGNVSSNAKMDSLLRPKCKTATHPSPPSDIAEVRSSS